MVTADTERTGEVVGRRRVLGKMKLTTGQKAWRTRKSNLEKNLIEDIRYSKRADLKDAIQSAIFLDPNNFGVLQKLIEAVGMETTEKIVREYEGQIISIPRAESVWNSYRMKFIFYCLRKKHDRYVISELARFFSISEGNVRTIFKVEKERRAFRHSRPSKLMRTAIDQIIEKSELDRNLHPPYP